MGIGIALWLFASQTWATPGITGQSGKDGSNCSSCHLGTGAAPAVAVTGPNTLVANTTAVYTLTLAGGPGVAGAADIGADDGGLNIVSSVISLLGNELATRSPMNFVDGGASWPFRFTAPAGPGSVKIYAAANSVNLNGANTGDHSATTVFTVTITAPNRPPFIVTAADAGPSPNSGTSAHLTVLAGDLDDGGEAALTYVWSAQSDAGTVAFSANSSNAAKSSTATFTTAGNYTFTATAKDPQNASVMSATSVQVAQKYSAVKVSPSTATLPIGNTLQLSATALDQFGHLMTAGAFTWSTDAGTISSGGLYTPPTAVGGPYLVTAKNGTLQGQAAITIAAGQPPHIAQAPMAAAATPTTVALTVLGADDNPESQLKYTWVATGPAAVAFAPNGNNAAKHSTATLTKAGAYDFHVTIVDSAGLNADAGVADSVAQAFTSLKVMPATATVLPLDTAPFTASPLDQFAHPMSLGGACTWLATGGGTVDATGTFHAAGSLGGPFEVRATMQGQVASALVTVSNSGAPFFATAPTALPAVVTGHTTQLLASAEDEGGEPALSYHWDATGPAPVTFAPNDTHAARAGTATFSQAGTYMLMVTAKNADGKTASAQLDVEVQQVPETLALSPAFSALKAGGTQQFTATAEDQFGTALPDTGHVDWTASGAGEIDGNGLLLARSSPGNFSVGATALGLHATSAVLVDTQAPVVTLAEPQVMSVLKGPTHLVANATDDFVVAAVRFYVDGQQIGDDVTTAPFDVLWNTPATTDGEHTLRIEADDAAGNTGHSADLPITVWNDPNRPAPGPGVATAGCSTAGATALLPAVLALLLRRRRATKPAVERSLP